MPKVSIIVPVYNIEYYITRCLNSLCRQTFKNIEILIIDDGSTDSTVKIINRYADKDKRIRVISKKNGGVSSARNVGIKEAKGKYIMFVDGDDWLSSKAIKILVDTIERTRSDFCFGTAAKIQRNNNYGKKVRNMSLTKNDSCFTDYIESIESAPWAKLFSAEIIKNNDLSFPLGIAFGEDAIFVYQYLQHCVKFSSINELVYYYNCLNMENASSKYYPNINQWLIDSMKEYEKLFWGSSGNVDKAIVGRALNIYDLINKHYVANEYKIGQTEVIKKLEETYSLFFKYIPSFEKYSFDSEYLSKCKEIYRIQIKKKDFGDLYNKLKNEEQIKVDSKIKMHIKKLYISIKKYILFKMNLDYLYD